MRKPGHVRSARSEDGMAMPLAMVAVAIVGMLIVAMAGLSISQITPTAKGRAAVRSIHAAEAGANIALSRIKAARDSGGAGAPSLLPCADYPAPALEGTVTVETGTPSYRVLIRYYSVDPSARDEAWRTTHAIPCASTGGLSSAPRHALIQSSGIVGGRTRTLESVYDFAIVGPANIPGGLIRAQTLEQTASPYCIAAESAAQWARVRLATCSETDERQRWAYRKDMTLALASTVDTSTPLCIDAENGVSAPVTLERCDSDRWMRQAWAYVDRLHWVLPTSTGGLSDWCMTWPDLADGQPLSTATKVCGVKPQATAHRYRPDIRVGAGAAGSTDGYIGSIGQLVNLEEFGRCWDINNFNFDAAYHIAWPCKQALDPAYIGWNQKLTATAKANGTVLLSASDGTETRCLTLGDGLTAPFSGIRVLTKPCDATNPLQEWVMTGKQASYPDSYTVRSNGLCMRPIATAEANSSSTGISEIQAHTCDGSRVQKWNAPPEKQLAGLRNIREVAAP